VFFILSYFCPNVIIRTKLDKNRTKVGQSFSPILANFVLIYSGSINDDDENDQAKTGASSTMKNQCMFTWLFKDIYYQRKQYYF
jgi:hypothetical protein